jgi:hypothetical protein
MTEGKNKELQKIMRWRKLQFGVHVLAAVAMLAMSGLACAQKPHPDRPPQHEPQPHPQQHPANTNHPPANTSHPPTNNYAPQHPNQPQNPRPNPNGNAHPNPNFNNGANAENGVHSGTGAVYNPTTRQQLGIGAPKPWVDQMRDLSGTDREHVLQNSKAFQNLSPDKQTKIRQQFNQWDRMTPQQRATLRENEATWRKLTPDQREHIKNDVLPKWHQMPWDRQQAIKQKLGVLQHMPESARNQRLGDPNFTRGMSDEERSTLTDLAHMHVGAPEPPSE